MTLLRIEIELERALRRFTIFLGGSLSLVPWKLSLKLVETRSVKLNAWEGVCGRMDN